MIDLHTHILPGVDDGAADLDEALAMLRIAEGEGTGRIVATPHHDGLDQERQRLILARLAELRSAASAAGLAIAILGGFELLLTTELAASAEVAESLGLNGGRYLLVEIPPGLWPLWVSDALFRLQGRGLRPILAHAERYPAIASDLRLAEDLVRRGILLQVNADSLTGERGGEAARCAIALLDRGLVSIVASDAHSPRTRAPRLRAARAAAARRVGEAAASALVDANPAAVLDGADLPPAHHRPRRAGALATLGRLLGVRRD